MICIKNGFPARCKNAFPAWSKRNEAFYGNLKSRANLFFNHFLNIEKNPAKKRGPLVIPHRKKGCNRPLFWLFLICLKFHSQFWRIAQLLVHKLDNLICSRFIMLFRFDGYDHFIAVRLNERILISFCFDQAF